MTRRRLLILGGSAILAFASLVYAQRIFVGGGGRSRFRPRFATLEDFDGSFLYCRGFYRSTRGEAGGQGWSTDYPGADNNFSIRLSELTRVPVKWDPTRQPIYVVVRLDDPLLYRCPMLFMEDTGTIQFSVSEIAGLRDYLLKGGFLWVDDFWGSRAWDQWVAELQRVLPKDEFPIIDIPLSHPIMHTVYDVTNYLQVSSINFWYRSGGSVSERGFDSAQVHYRGIEDSRKRLMVMMTHNTDVADTWEREGENKEYFTLFSPRGYAIGVNVVVYALTH
jgi:Domain of unknown function (DUF4159)